MDLLSLREGAKELKLSIHTLRAWTYQKRIPFVRLGRRILLRREDLENLVKKNLIETK
ncbi:MAG: helix-turn-helix domain-containing protein [Thermodesulfobacteriota bacterium]